VRAVALIRAAHLQPVVAVTAVSVALAVSVGRELSGALVVGVAVLAGQLSVGWSNDYFDRDRDRSANRRDKPIVTGAISAHAVGAAALIALIACVPLSLLSGWRAAAVHLVAVGAAWAYNAALKRTVWSVVPYLLAFAALPVFVTLGLPGHPWPKWWAILAAALLGAGAHFINTVADTAADAVTGVYGLPQRIGPRASALVGALLMVAAIGVVAIGVVALGAQSGDEVGVGLLVMALVGAVVAAVAATTGSARLAWSITLATALIGAGALIAQGTNLVA